MATNWKAMQVVETTIDKVKERRAPGDVNRTALSRGSWLASLSKGGQPSRSMKGNSGSMVTAKGKK
jgi:hypothetical protein